MTKGEKMTRAELLQMLEAVVVTRAQHEMAIDQGIDFCEVKSLTNDWQCHLCQLYIKSAHGAEVCITCPWQRFEGVQCYLWDNELNYHNSEASIVRLTEWEDKINTILSELGD